MFRFPSPDQHFFGKVKKNPDTLSKKQNFASLLDSHSLFIKKKSCDQDLKILKAVKLYLVLQISSSDVQSKVLTRRCSYPNIITLE